MQLAVIGPARLGDKALARQVVSLVPTPYHTQIRLRKEITFLPQRKDQVMMITFSNKEAADMWSSLMEAPSVDEQTTPLVFRIAPVHMQPFTRNCLAIQAFIGRACAHSSVDRAGLVGVRAAGRDRRSSI